MSDGAIRVLHILGEILPSGAETMLASAEGRMQAAGIQNEALSTGEVVGSFAGELERTGFLVHHIPFRKSPDFFRRVYRLFRSRRFDVVHVHTERAFFYYILVARAAGTPGIVRTVHHIFPWTGWLRLRAAIQRNVASHFLGAKFVSNSASGRENERRCFKMSNALIPNWYDSDYYVPRSPAEYIAARAQIGILPEKCLLVSLGGNSSYKNYDMIVKAMGQLPKDNQSVYMQIGNEGEGKPLSELVAQLGLEDRVICCGRVQSVLPYLQAADAFVMPSSIEGFGVAAVEAMAVGVPAILSRRPALIDFAAVSNQIIWVECSPASIAAGITEIEAESPAARWARGTTLARSMPEYCGLDVGPSMFADLYTKLATSGNKRIAEHGHDIA